MADPDRFDEEELTGDDFQGKNLASNPPAEHAQDKTAERGDNFEGRRVEKVPPPILFKSEDLGEDDSFGQEARV